MDFNDFDTQIQSDELEEDIMEYNESMPCAPTMQKTLYYDMPTQVKFFDFDGEEPYWIGGTYYQNFGDAIAAAGDIFVRDSEGIEADMRECWARLVEEN